MEVECSGCRGQGIPLCAAQLLRPPLCVCPSLDLNRNTEDTSMRLVELHHGFHTAYDSFIEYCSHTTQFPHLKHTNQQFLVQSQFYNAYHINVRTFSLFQKKSPSFCCYSPIPPCPLSPRKPQVYVPSLQICLFRTFCVNRIPWSSVTGIFHLMFSAYYLFIVIKAAGTPLFANSV